MKELSKNARQLLFAIREGDKGDIGAHELGMTHDEFIDAGEELMRESRNDQWGLKESGQGVIFGVKLQSPSLTARGEDVFKELRKD